jgi:hypothetical protein
MNMFWIAMTTAIVPITIFLCQLSESRRPRKRYNGNIAAMRRTKESGQVLRNKQVASETNEYAESARSLLRRARMVATTSRVSTKKIGTMA